MFPMLLNATVVNVYPSALLEQFTNWLYKQELNKIAMPQSW